jgi:hypothetical protein
MLADQLVTFGIVDQRRQIRAGCEWKSMIGCSRFDDNKDLATGDRHATLIGEPFDQLRGLIWFERRPGHGAVKPAGGGLPSRILWKGARRVQLGGV